MRLFSKRLYHGTPHKFDKFDTEHIGTGEGAQVHGWGLYFAENKDVANHYRIYTANRDGKIKISIDGKEIIVNDKSEMLDELIKFSAPESMIYAFNNALDEYSWRTEILRFYKQVKYKIEQDEKNANEKIFVSGFGGSMTRLEALKKAEEIINWSNEHNFTASPFTSKLITIEIPGDLVFAEESDTIENQPKQVIEALNQIADDVITVRKIYKIPGAPSVKEDIKNIMRKYVSSERFIANELDSIIYTFNYWYEDYDTAPDVNVISHELETVYHIIFKFYDDSINWNDFANDILDYVNQYSSIERECRWDSFEEFYDDYSSVGSPKETSLKLESLGVNGIHYNGNQDGSCYVIFNPEHIKIIEVE